MEELLKTSVVGKQQNTVKSYNKKQDRQSLVIKLSKPAVGKVRTQEVIKVFLPGTVERSPWTNFQGPKFHEPWQQLSTLLDNIFVKIVPNTSLSSPTHELTRGALKLFILTNIYIAGEGIVCRKILFLLAFIAN